MIIVNEPPPNYDEIVAAIPAAKNYGVFFAFGNRIFNPDNVSLDASLIAHERVHGDRQGDDPRGWWRRYLDDQQFRFAEELIAHCIEWQHVRDNGGTRNERRAALAMIAKRLSSPLYGSLVSFESAKRMIKEGAKP